MNLKSDMVTHMTGCCSTCLCVCVCKGAVLLALKHCHASAACHLTLQQHFLKAGLVIGGNTGTTVLFRGLDRDFNPYPSKTGWGKTKRTETNGCQCQILLHNALQLSLNYKKGLREVGGFVFMQTLPLFVSVYCLIVHAFAAQHLSTEDELLVTRTSLE